MFKIISITVLIILLLILGPLLTIWSLNILFPVLAIPYIWQTWVAVILLASAVRGSSK